MHSSFFLTIQNRRALGTVQKRTTGVKITFQNQTINENDNRTESNRTEKNSWGKDKTWRSKKNVNVNFGAVYESGQAAVSMLSLEKEENNKGKSLMELQQDASILEYRGADKSSPNLCVHSSSSYVSPSMLPLSSGDLIEWSLVCHSTLSYQKFCDRHSNHYDHPEELHQSVE